MTTHNTRWKARLARALQSLRAPYGGGTLDYKTTVSASTLRQLRATIPFGRGDGLRGLGGAVTDTALRLFLALVSPSGKAAEALGLDLSRALEAHPDLVERLTENLVVLADNMNAGIEYQE